MEQIKKKIGRPLPEWILNLKKGEYSINDLIKISKTSRTNCLKLMKKFNTETIYKRENDRVCAYYKWEGLDN